MSFPLFNSLKQPPSFLKRHRIALVLYFSILASILINLTSAAAPATPTPPLTLEFFLQKAVNQSEAVKIAIANNKLAEAEEWIFWSTILPKISGGISTPPAFIQVVVNQKIYDYGTPARYRASQYDMAAAKANYELAVNETIYDVRDAYARALFLQKVALLTDSYAKELESSLKTVDLQFEAGKLTKNEVQRLYVRTSLARKNAEDQKIEETRLKELLFRTSGIPLQPNILLAESESFHLPEIMDPTKLIEIAFQQRRDLYTLENLKLSKNENIQILKSFELPKLDLTGISDMETGNLGVRTGYKSTYVNKFQRTDDFKEDFSAKLRINNVLSWRIYQGGLIRGEIKTAQSEVIEQEVLLQRIRTNIPSQVKAALELVTLANDQWKLTSEFDSQAALEASKADFDNGKAKQLDLLDTQETVLTQRIQKAAAESNLTISKSSLDRATGLGIRFIHDSSVFKK